MNKFIIRFGIIISLLITSCVPYKDTKYLNENNTNTDAPALIEKQKPYRIQISDILDIRVKASRQELVTILNPTGDGNLNASGVERAYTEGFTVDLHGNIRMPVLGKLNVLGYTAEEIEELIKKQLLEKEFKEAANLFVTVKLSGFRYTVNGEIGSPGTRTLYQDRVNIFEAIANSGEIPITGNKKDVLIIRQYPQGQKIHHLDLTDVKILNSPYYYIQPNDIITVQPLKQKSWGTGTNGIQTLTTIFSIVSLVTTSILIINRF
ncbi:sugar transporter [Flavobacteriaceae bacterium AU392]|nr:sugar transporter [Flavobacteriaceae bacterium]RKM82808.1 sugar transporter [Flavobacteriaceae bacterium AU392]